ncbi:dTDP-glucose 4,6-dehydratase [Rhizobium sp. CECT 9324]|uniref:dTDP-glucose 4,6-dehydratase n=1 Tax=Rhizobium sp. CECT 9324 TaxID=2845820 RepID=UPI001E2AED37|nr:dTDP-glucose 4,6-dehydratase [Rhizobium sp. CECT 9324]CAH0343179.1 dTDP-glucose 4,6-dehydratase [Rhizobium sp. CECT 9324]
MTVVVTGGAGFIGSNFVLNWLSQNEECVVNLDKLTYAGNRESLAEVHTDERYTFVRADIGDISAVSALLDKYQPRALINFAAESHVDRSIDSPADFVETNVVGTFRLLETTRLFWQSLPADRKAEFRFLHISTDEVYGSLDASASAFRETNQYQPNSPYAASKAASDHFVRAYYHTYGLPVLTTNCSNNYGPYQFPEKLIPLCIYNAINGRPLPVYGDGQQVRDWLYVRDHCSAIMHVLQQGVVGETYNIGGQCEMTNLEVLKLLCAILDELAPRSDGRGYADQITFVKDRPGHDRRYAVDTSKIEMALDWKPEETFESGLRKTVQWYLQNQIWVANVVSGEYQGWVGKQYG